MYYRISGAPFTIKNAEEKKEFINIINSDINFSRHLVCRGIDAERFSGKVNGVVVCEKENPSKIYVFKCDGNFPTLKLYQRTSAVIYIIEFPVKNSKPTVGLEEKTEKTNEITSIENEIIVKDEIVEEPNIQELEEATEKDQITEEFSEIESVEELVENTDQEIEPSDISQEDVQSKPKRRSRRKKS